MLRIVLDTNVVVSAFIDRHSPPAAILDAWDREAFGLIISMSLLVEYRRFLRYDKLQRYLYFTPAEMDAIVERFQRAGTLVTPTRSLHVIVDDPSGNIFLECASAGGADDIVSGDRHLLTIGTFEGISILRPSEFLRDVLEADVDSLILD